MRFFKPCPNVPAASPQPLRGAWRVVACPACGEIITIPENSNETHVQCSSEHNFQLDQNICNFNQLVAEHDGITKL